MEKKEKIEKMKNKEVEAMKKGCIVGIAGIFCLMFIISGCGSREKKNIVGASGSAVMSTSSAAKVLTTDALDALKAVSKTSTATGSGPSGNRAPGLTATQRLASPSLSSGNWEKPTKDANGYYIMKFTDPEDGTVFDVRVKPTPDWWSMWDDNTVVKMPWEDLSEGADFTSTFDVKGTFDGPSNSGVFTDASKEIRKVKTYIYTWTNPWTGQVEQHTWKGLDWTNTIRTHIAEGTITNKADNSWVKMKNTGTSSQSDPAGYEAAGTMTMSETSTMTFTLSSGYTGKFDMKVAGTIYHAAYWASTTQNVKGQIDGSIYQSGTEMVRLHLEGKGKETGDGPDMSSIIGYYTTKDDNFTAKTPLTTEQILSIFKMVFGMGGKG